MAQFAASGVQPAGASLPVSRGAKFQTGFLGLDSLYIVLEYPARDVFDFWSALVKDAHDPRLYDGIPFEDFLIRRGGLGYKLSVWDGDARLFITDRVAETLKDSTSADQGMGVMLQLGPKWLCQWGDVSNHQRFLRSVYSQFIVFGIQNPDQYLARLNRVDLTLDVLGLAVEDFSVDEWRRQWVGHAKQKHFYDSARTGKLEGLAIGSSSGAVRFKVYDKVAESKKRGTSDFWRSVWSVSEDEPLSVARFEWSIQPFKGRFIGLRYLPDLTYESFVELLNYVTLKWGRLCDPADDDNPTRRELAPMWLAIRQLIEAWTYNFEGQSKRDYHLEPDLSSVYLKSAAGWIAGLMARVGVTYDLDTPSTVTEALDILTAEGLRIHEKASEKWEIYSRLVGKDRLE